MSTESQTPKMLVLGSVDLAFETKLDLPPKPEYKFNTHRNTSEQRQPSRAQWQNLLAAALAELAAEKNRGDKLEAERLRLAGVAAALDSESLLAFAEQLQSGDTGWPIVHRLLTVLARQPERMRWAKPRQLDNPTTLGQRIKSRRLAKGMLQKTLAALARIPVPTLSSYETDRNKPPVDVLAALASGLACELADLAGPTTVAEVPHG